MMILRHNRRQGNFSLNPYAFREVKFVDGYCCIDENDPNFKDTEGFLKYRGCDEIPIENVPTKIKEYFELISKKSEMKCAYSICGKTIKSGKYCSRDCANKDKVLKKTK